MLIKYRELMKEYKVEMDNPVLAKDFVSKAKEFEEKLAASQLTDEEIETLDAELVELFKTKHDFLEEDSEEVQRANKEKERAQTEATATAEIAEAETAEALNGLSKKYAGDFPQLQKLIDKKLKAIEAQAKKDSLEKLFAIARKEIADCPVDELQAMGEKYKQYPELTELIRKRIEDALPKKNEKEMAEKLLSKKEWTYTELQALNIKPTGNNMTVFGVRLEKEYLLNIYSVRR